MEAGGLSGAYWGVWRNGSALTKVGGSEKYRPKIQVDGEANRAKNALSQPDEGVVATALRSRRGRSFSRSGTVAPGEPWGNGRRLWIPWEER